MTTHAHNRSKGYNMCPGASTRETTERVGITTSAVKTAQLRAEVKMLLALMQTAEGREVMGLCDIDPRHIDAVALMWWLGDGRSRM